MNSVGNAGTHAYPADPFRDADMGTSSTAESTYIISETDAPIVHANATNPTTVLSLHRASTSHDDASSGTYAFLAQMALGDSDRDGAEPVEFLPKGPYSPLSLMRPTSRSAEPHKHDSR